MVYKRYLCHKVSKDNRPDLYTAYGHLDPIYLLFYLLDLLNAAVLFVEFYPKMKLKDISSNCALLLLVINCNADIC